LIHKRTIDTSHQTLLIIARSGGATFDVSEIARNEKEGMPSGRIDQPVAFCDCPKWAETYE
jgi:hypothetical protein